MTNIIPIGGTHRTAEEYLGDICRITYDAIGDEAQLKDCFLVYLTKDAQLSYVGQSLAAVDPLQMIGMLEVIKQLVLDATAYE